MRLLIKHNKLTETENNQWAWVEWKRKSYNYFIEFTRGRMGRSCQKDELLTVDSWIEDDCHPIAKLQIFGNFDEAEDSLPLPALQVGGVSLYIIIVVVIVVISLVLTTVVSSIRLFSRWRRGRME